MKAIAPDAKVELVRQGFLRYRKPPKFEGLYHYKGDTGSIEGPWKLKLDEKGNQIWSYYKLPCVWRERWTASDSGQQEKYFYLHPGNFDDGAFVASVIKSFKKDLRAIYISGIKFPTRPMWESFLNELQPQGFLMAAMEYKRADGADLGAQDIESWTKQRLHILAQQPTDPNLILSQPMMFHPTFYLLQKN